MSIFPKIYACGSKLLISYWVPFSLLLVKTMQKFISIHSARYSVDPFSLKTQVMKCWKISLHYFIDDFFFILSLFWDYYYLVLDFLHLSSRVLLSSRVFQSFCSTSWEIPWTLHLAPSVCYFSFSDFIF